METIFDDAAPAGSDHAPAGLLGAVEAPDQEILQGLLNLRGGELRGVAVDALPGNVGQDVDAAELPVQRGVERVDLLRVRDVGHHRNGPPTQRPDRRSRVLHPLRVDVREQQIGPVLGEPDRHRAAHPAGRTGHHGDAIGQVEQIASHVQVSFRRSRR